MYLTQHLGEHLRRVFFCEVVLAVVVVGGGGVEVKVVFQLALFEWDLAVTEMAMVSMFIF